MTVRTALSKIGPSIYEGSLSSVGLIVILGLVLFPLASPSNYLLHIAVLVFVYVALGLGLNIVVGLAGLLDLGYVAFYAVGAYSYALLSTTYHLPFPVTLVIGGVFAAAVGVILGWPTIRSRGDYLALVTLGFGEIIRLLLRNWDSLTNGPRGIMDVPAPRVAGVSVSTPLQYYYFGLLLGAAALILFWRVKYSAAGQQLIAIRDDEDAAAAIGINPVRWKLYAFALGAFIAGIAGVFFASWQRFVSPESFTLGESILILSIVVLGGMGRLWPTVFAAAFLVLLPEALRGLETYRVLVLGFLLVLVVVLQERLRLMTEQRRHALPGHGSIKASRALSSPGSLNPRQGPFGEIILSVSGVRKHFGGVRALDDVSFEIRKGEIVGLVGVNGAGKTTLFGCLSGAVRPDGGAIYLNKGGDLRMVNGLAAHEVARQGIIRTFQQPKLFASLTSSENAQLGARCHDTPPLWEPFLPLANSQALALATATRLLTAVNAPPAPALPAHMGFVDEKLTELARALAADPELLLVDEPASGMEPSARRQLAAVLRWANEELGTTIVVIEHDLAFLGSICNRLIVLDRGGVIANGPSSDPNVLHKIEQTYHGTGGFDVARGA